MRPQKPFPNGTTERLQQLLARTTKPVERQRIQAVLMRAMLSATPAQIAAVTGFSVNTVRILHSRFLREGESCLVGRPGRGGRRHGLLSVEQERDFLKTYEAQAAQGLVLSVNTIKDDCENLLGRRVSRTSIYRMMERSGWRKVVPRPFHPKKAPESEECFKKTTRKSSPKRRAGTGEHR